LTCKKMILLSVSTLILSCSSERKQEHELVWPITDKSKGAFCEGSKSMSYDNSFELNSDLYSTYYQTSINFVGINFENNKNEETMLAQTCLNIERLGGGNDYFLFSYDPQKPRSCWKGVLHNEGIVCLDAMMKFYMIWVVEKGQDEEFVVEKLNELVENFDYKFLFTVRNQNGEEYNISSSHDFVEKRLLHCVNCPYSLRVRRCVSRKCDGNICSDLECR